jgi:homotetrameric cytidine deaminase/rRNA maturation RNase YbeY
MIELDSIAGAANEALIELMRYALRVACKLEGIPEADAYVRLTDDCDIRSINRETRGLDEATDVLSFPTVAYKRGTARDNRRALRREADPETAGIFVGDIIISLGRVQSQAATYGHSEARELLYLFTHGFLHLLGYDHIQESDRAAMRDMEESVLSAISLSKEATMTDNEMFLRACEALKGAYVPYSGFKVGACLLAEDGRVFSGCNIENASYGASICAERTALVKGVSEGARAFTAIAVAAERTAAWPCGICRQALNEFAADGMKVIVGQAGCAFEVAQFSDILPRSFGPNALI